MTYRYRELRAERAALTDHLLHHPGHARRYPAGYDFVQRPTTDIRDDHERLHQGLLSPDLTHLHPQGLKVPGERGYVKREEEVSKTLELKVTVACSDQDPDTVLAKMNRDALRLAASPYSLKVTRVERADGQPFGLESAFEEYWRETHCEGDDGGPDAKLEAREAFLYGVKYGKGKAGNS